MSVAPPNTAQAGRTAPRANSASSGAAKPRTAAPQPIMPGKGQRLVALLLVVFAYMLFLLAIVALPTRLMQLSGNGIREDLLAGKKISDADLDAFIASRENAASLRPSGEIMDDIALATFNRAQRKGLTTQAGHTDLLRALAWQQEALAKAPADSYGWIQLAYLLLQTEGLSNNAATALARSVQTNPYEPRLMLPRLNMAVMLMDKLDPETRAKMPDMVRACWKLNALALVKAAKDNSYVSVVESALANDSRATATFRNLLASLSLPPPAKK